MPGRPPINIQDSFLFGTLKEGGEVAVALTTGKYFSAKVVRFDRFAVVFETAKQRMLVYKHAIVSIVEDLDVAMARDARQSRPAPRRAAVGGPRRAATQW